MKSIRVLVLLVLVSGLTTAQEGKPLSGAATPEEVVKRYEQAVREGNNLQVEAILTPAFARATRKLQENLKKHAEVLTLQHTFQQELQVRFGEKRQPNPFAAPVKQPADQPSAKKDQSPVTKMPHYSVELVNKEPKSPEKVELTVSIRELENGPKKEMMWEVVKEGGRWYLMMPQMQPVFDMQELLAIVSTDESIADMRKVIDDLKQGKYTSQADAQKAWNKITRISMPGDLKNPLVLPAPLARANQPGPPLPKPVDTSRHGKKVEFKVADKVPSEGLEAMRVPDSEDKVYVAKEARLTHEDIATVEVIVDAAREPCVQISFSESGQKKMEKLSEEQLGRPLAILVDGKLISAPVIRSKLSERVIIAGKFTKEQVEQLVRDIRGEWK